MNANCIAIKTGDMHFCNNCSDETCEFSPNRRGWKCQKCGNEMVALRSTGDIVCFNCNHVVPAFCGDWERLMDKAVKYAKRSTAEKRIEKEEPKMKVSYKGVTGKLKKLEYAYNTYMNKDEYILEISDEADGHKHVFESVDVSEIKFIGATVTLA